MPYVDNAVLVAKQYRVLFFIYYASRDENGEMWCPDCRDVEALVKETFEKTHAMGLVFYVGTKPEWKSEQNRYRRQFNIQRIPTIVQMTNTVETLRMEEGDILRPGNLQAMIDKAAHPLMSWPLTRPDPDTTPVSGEEPKPLIYPYHEIAYDAKAVKPELSSPPHDSKKEVVQEEQTVKSEN